ncbi:MAG: homocysteine S-methyltransferase family protein [Oscillospiraceae bacterium]|jgi:5-methyltetrahydrofolate--homocysteine methyltransferase|nr:homocysteine S-methyltransferase family protein [Oscillospiraceae bacterium]
MNFRDSLTKRILFFDGAMGTALQAQGLRPGEAPEGWNTAHPERLIALHGQYLTAGCDVITTNTFGANPLKLAGGLDVTETVTAAVRNVKTAIALSAPRRQAFCALDIGPTGKLLAPGGDLSFEDAVAAFAVPIRAGVAAGADVILIETMTDPYEMKAALIAAKENSTLPLVASFSLDRAGKLLTGGGVDVLAALAEGLGADAVSLNCGFGPDIMEAFVQELSQLCALPILVMPNAGLPHSEDGKTVFDVTPAQFAAQMERIAHIPGVCLLGGCCGTTPAHLRETIALCGGIAPTAPIAQKRMVVSSYARTVTIGESPKVIGERINPTGKKKLQAALREEDWEYVAGQGLSQQADGADILDVNCGLPGIDEATALRTAVAVLQAALPLPLQLDSANPAALEAGLRAYNGIPLVNSVNGKAQSLSAVLPLVQKYGGVLVCLTLDEGGIPETPAGRLAIAEKIAARAADGGIPRHRLLFDPLCMAVSADENAAVHTLESLKLITRALGVHTVLGVSNVSFGLPNRDVVSAAFLTQALSAGLKAAILNPGSALMRQAWATHNLLSGHDAQCAHYLAHAQEYGAATSTATAQSAHTSLQGATPLIAAVLQGLEKKAYGLALSALETEEPNALIAQELIPALAQVGEAFAAGTLFLPQLMQSAKAAQEVGRAVKEALASSGKELESRGSIALATVEGDVHDIGKNIVRVMLENHGFSVLDLGKNVPPDVILQAVREHEIPTVGLSALMTTTVPAMAATVALLKEHVPGVRVLVGGAVLTQKAADAMGADGYAADAMGAVRLMNAAELNNALEEGYADVAAGRLHDLDDVVAEMDRDYNA